ncbi:hypothetical protein [Actinomadura roseirufa]|uniref:hypothetical protein n=1 Tax=Actinomadura roseirufa TaxID=2094049 RepID=UPI001A954CB5|nr:hypothetical protein [Actinomadura roseirufa]
MWVLAQALKAHGYVAEVAESAPVLAVSGTSGTPISVSCDRRPECGGGLWFFLDGAPMAPADDAHMPETIVAFKGKLLVGDAFGSAARQTDPERLRGYLTDLDRAVSARPELACGVVVRMDGKTVLNVIRLGSPRRFVEITAVEAFGEPWFAWVKGGRLIGPVHDAATVAYSISCELSPLGRP